MSWNAVFEALAHPARRQVLELLKDRDRTAGELVKAVGLSNSTLSAHLQKLKQADLVTVDRQGSRRIYRLNVSVFEEVMLSFMNRMQPSQGDRQ